MTQNYNNGEDSILLGWSCSNFCVRILVLFDGMLSLCHSMILFIILLRQEGVLEGEKLNIPRSTYSHIHIGISSGLAFIHFILAFTLGRGILQRRHNLLQNWLQITSFLVMVLSCVIVTYATTSEMNAVIFTTKLVEILFTAIEMIAVNSFLNELKREYEEGRNDRGERTIADPWTDMTYHPPHHPSAHQPQNQFRGRPVTPQQVHYNEPPPPYYAVVGVHNSLFNEGPTTTSNNSNLNN